MPFPTQFPQSAMQHLVAELTGQGAPPIGQLVEDAYDVLGYGLYLRFGSGGQRTMLKACGELSHLEKAAVLKEAPPSARDQCPLGRDPADRARSVEEVAGRVAPRGRVGLNASGTVEIVLQAPGSWHPRMIAATTSDRAWLAASFG
jgi:hypothetical protein